MKIEEWNDKTNKKHIVDTLHQNYTDSMENKEKCIAGVLLKLEQGEFPYCPPHGLKRVNREWLPRKTRNEKTTLMQDEEMLFIRHAFEMKAKGRTAKEICQYLKQYGNISISGKNLVETLFANPVYKGIYTEKTTGRAFQNIKFWEWKSPIDSELWERANAKVGKRGYGFGEWQVEHIAPWILKHESGKNLYLYKAKGIYNAYQTEIKGENGKRKSIGIMESALVRKFLDYAIPKILNAYQNIGKQISTSFIENQKRFTKDFINKYPSWGTISMLKLAEKTPGNIIGNGVAMKVLNYTESQNGDIEIEFMVPKTIDEKMKKIIEERTGIDFVEILKESPEISMLQNEARSREQQKKELEEKKQALEEEKKSIDKKAFKLWYTADVANEMKQETENEIREIEAQIDLLSESTDIEEYLDRLPNILLDLHELSSRVLSEADYEDLRDDIRQLMEIVSHELILTNKKELKVKLLEGLENLETVEMWNGAQLTSHTRTAIKEFVENYDRVKANYTSSI